ncbi:YfhO family protein [Georgenia sp. 311]|uniref:YfhO family protein n=1 Tax=Georgenia wutianyii TaxID=2585135 RepID=A0ABX5VL89_9MICO|nr:MULTISPECIES: YfhO family protein [Georgenia]QDB78476.1 YfhO family protein [Georgenia wutianyii]TNC16513.1 YfhO family protein [Georgenia sp. 311]
MTAAQERRRARLGTVAAWAPLVALVVLLLGPALVGAQLFAAGDLIERQAPWAEASTVETVTNACVSDTVDAALPHALSFRDRIAAGDAAPLWESSASAGTILGAAPFQGVVSPIFLATLPLPDVLFPAWMKLLEIGVVLLGTVLWARRLGLSVAAGALGGFLYATSGYLVMWTGWPQTRTAAFFPLVFWAVERIVQDRTLRSALPLPFVVAGVVLGGFPAIVVHTVYLAALYGVVRLVVLNRRERPAPGGSPWRRWGRAPALAAAGGLAGLALVAFQVVPWAQQLRESVDLERRASAWQLTLDWPEILTMAYPEALGSCASGAARWGSLIPVEGVSFVGAGALVLCVAALVMPPASDRLRAVRGFLLLAIVLTLAVTFVGGGLNYLVQLLPGMGGSGLQRTRAVGGLMFAMLAAVGFDSLVRGPRPGVGRRRWALAAAVAVVAALGVAALLVREVAPGPAEWAQARPSVVLGLVAGVLVAAAWAAVLVRPRPAQVVAAVLVPLVLAVEGITFAAAWWPRADPDTLYRDTRTDAFLSENLGHDRMVGMYGAYWYSAAQVPGLRSLSGHTFTPEEWRALLLAADKGMFRSATSHSLSSPQALTSPVLDRFATRYAVMDTHVIPPGSFWGDGEQGTGVVRAGAGADGPVAARTVEAGTPVRAALVELAEPLGDVPEGGDPGRLVVEALDEDGKVLATGSRRLRDGESGVVGVALAGEELPTDGPVTLQVRVEGGPGVELRAAGDNEAQRGEAWLGVIVAGDDDLTLVDTTDALVLERENALPRFRWASDAAECTDAPECAALMAQVPGSTVLLEDADVAAFDGAGAEIEVLRDDDDLQQVRVEADGAGMLVVADGVHSGWVARLDGQEVPILTADHAMRGVAVPAGEHVVELSYEPTGWGALPWVAGATAVGLLGLWLWLARAGRPADRPRHATGR